MFPAKPSQQLGLGTRFVSTRDRTRNRQSNFVDVMLKGLADDGGLFVPLELPYFSNQEIIRLSRLSYVDLGFAITSQLIGNQESLDVQHAIWNDFAGHFDAPAIAPLSQLTHQLWLLELYHGPTLAFKDYSLQWLAAFIDRALASRNAHATVLAATSGDTGGATVAAMRARERIATFVLYPQKGPSEVQIRQMTAFGDHRAHALAIDGTFDDCQDIVKACFTDPEFQKDFSLCAVNSINFARIAAQIVYYAYAALRLGDEALPATFVVPTGNFGNALAAYYAKQMGFPIGMIVIASNENDCLCQLIRTGQTQLSSVKNTLSPSMDIQIPSNFERLLYDAYGRDCAAMMSLLEAYRAQQPVILPPSVHDFISTQFIAASLSDAETLTVMENWAKMSQRYLDPHSAVGVGVGETLLQQKKIYAPVACVATAHIDKFPQVLEQVLQRTRQSPPGLHPRIDRFLQSPESLISVRASTAAVQDKIRSLSAQS